MEDDFVIKDGVLIKYNGNDEIVVIPDNVLVIGKDAFADCTNISSVFIPNSVISISDRAFKGCESLIDVSFSDSIKNIGNDVFEDCFHLKHANFYFSALNCSQKKFDSDVSFFRDNLSCELIPCQIDDQLEGDVYESYIKSTWPDCDISNGFVTNNNLLLMYFGKESKVVVPDGIKALDQFCFFPRYVPYAFDDSEIETTDNDLNGVVKEVVLPNSLEFIDSYSFVKLESLESIRIPDSVKTISNFAFGNCNNLRDVWFGTGIKNIREGAFIRCQLKQVHLPVDCFVEDGAFDKDVKIIRDVKFKQEVDSSLERKQDIKKKNSI